MPRTKKYNEEEVIQKAMKAFWKNGYEGTSIRDLEREMGINLFSIYASFKDKQGVMLKALECYEKQLFNEAVIKLSKSDNGVDDVKQYFYDFVEFVREDNSLKGCFLTNSLVEVGSKDAEINSRVMVFASTLKNLFKKKLEDSVIKGDLPQNTNVIDYSNYLMGSLQGLATSSKFFDSKSLNDFIEITFKNLK